MQIGENVPALELAAALAGVGRAFTSGYGKVIADLKPDPVQSLSDETGLEELVARCQAGDRAAMESIYRIFQKPVFGIISRHVYNRSEAEDLLQDVFVKVFTSIDRVRDVITFPAWVYRIALNTCYSHLRGRRTEAGETVPLETVEDVVTAESPEGPETGRDFKGVLEKGIACLPRRLKQVFILHDVQGFKHEEIAGILGCSAGTSKSQLFKARLKLRAYLKSRRAV